MDETRGFVLLLMVAFHWFFTLGWILNVGFGQTLFMFFRPAQPFFAGVFILFCGISCRLSHSNLRRGLILAGVAVGISVFLYIFMPDEMIWFGILHFLAVGILLFALIRPLLDKLPPLAGVTGCAVLAAVTWHLPDYGGIFGTAGIPGLLSWKLPDSLISNVWLYPLGIGRGVSAADYFPILPWIFVFLAGSFVGIWAKQGRFPKFTYKSRARWLSWLGRHTLVIYVLHQPVFYGLALLLQAIL